MPHSCKYPIISHFVNRHPPQSDYFYIKEHKLALKDLISINDLTTTEIRQIFTTAADLKVYPLDYAASLAGCSVALIFEKPSLRTRVTFDLGAMQMGASCVYLDHQNVRLGERESE